MSLQVWLPLNGDLRNQGLSDLTFTGSNVTLTTNDGKMGSCYSSTGSGYIISDKKVFLGKNQSMFCWIKPNAFNSSSSLTGVCGQHRYPSCIGLGITLSYASATTGYACITCGNGSSRWYRDHKGSTLLTAGNWYHIGYTYDGTTVRLYVNGQLDGSYDLNLATIEDYFQCFMWSMTASGNALLNSYGLNGKLNDVRAYDHTLSQKEIKELSKGLMLHYTFNRGDYNAVTNLLPYPTPGSAITPGWDTTLHTRAISVSGWSNGYNSGVTNSSGTKDPQVGYHAHWELINDIPTMVFPRLNYSVSGVTVSRWLGISSTSALSGTLKTGTIYTVSFEAMADIEGRIIHGGYYYNNGSSTGFHDGYFYAKNIPVGKWKKYVFTFTAGTVSSGGVFYFYGMQGSNGTAYVRNPQVEVGAIAHDYVPSSKAKDTLIYDSSGMNHNGTITGTLSSTLEGNSRTVDGSTTRNYERNFYSSYFNGSSYVAYDTQMAIPDAYTIAFWIYKSSDGHVIDWRALSGEAGVQPVYLGNNKIQYYSSAGGSVYFDYTFNNNTWYHIAIAVTATTATLYVNGVKQQTISATLPAGTVAAFHVGCRASYVNIMTMYMRDLRLYATTLTDEDIKQICKTPFIIDDEQNIYGRELREGSGE